MYTDLSYAKKRLENTLVRLKEGPPFWVQAIYLEGSLQSKYKNEEEGEELNDSSFLNTVLGEPHYEDLTQPSPGPLYTFEIHSANTIEVESIKSIKKVQKQVVEQSLPKILCRGYSLPNKDSMEVSLSDLNLTPVPLGFCNLTNENTTIWVSRKPVRKYWRQGLGDGNVYIHDFNGKHRKFPNLKYLYHTIKGEYPSLDDAKQVVNSIEGSIIAFNRYFAISKDYLYYKNKEVGLSKNLSFYNKFEHLNEYFYEEVLNGNGQGTF